MSEQLVKRLRELSEAAARGDWNEFSLRVPVEKDRDADFVLLQAADKIAALEADAARYRFIREQHEGRPLHDGANFPDFTQPEVVGFCVFAPDEGELSPVGCLPGELDEAIDDALKGGA